MINEGSRIVNLFGGFSQGRVTLGLTVQNWIFYRVPAPVTIPMKVYLDGKQLRKTTLAAAGEAFPKWMQGRVQRLVSTWIPIGTQMFAMAPPDAIGGKLLEVWGITTPALLVNPQDSLTLDDEYADLIVEYAYMNLAYREGGKITADALRGYSGWMKRMQALQRFEQKVNVRFWIEADTGAAA